jgi:comEA protein
MKSKRACMAWIVVVCLGLLLGPAMAPAQQAKPVSVEKINLNTATVEQLQKLPGVGPALAKAIIEYRTKSGKFTKIEEIINVKGMGEKKFLLIKDRLTV